MQEKSSMSSPCGIELDIDRESSSNPLYFRDDVVEQALVTVYEDKQAITLYVNASEIPEDTTSRADSTEDQGELLVDILGRSGVFQEITLLLQNAVGVEDARRHIADTAQLEGRTDTGCGRFIIPLEL